VKAIIIDTLGTREESGTDAPIENVASLAFDDEKAMQHSECHRRHGQEIEGSGYFAVILKRRATSGWGPRAEPHDADVRPGSFRRWAAPAIRLHRRNNVPPASAPSAVVANNNPKLLVYAGPN